MGQRRGGHGDREGPEEPDWSSPEEDEEEASGGDRDFGVGGDSGGYPGPISASVSHSHFPGPPFSERIAPLSGFGLGRGGVMAEAVRCAAEATRAAIELGEFR